MRQKSISQKDPAEKVVRDIRRKTRRKHSTEEKIRIVLEGLRGEESIAALCRREGITVGRRTFWKQVRSVLLVIRHARRLVAK